MWYNTLQRRNKNEISSRNAQHQECMRKEKWDNSAVALHSRNCQGEIDFENTETVKVIYNKFDRKVREALEIQLNECGPKKGGMNFDEGQYVSTKFWIPFFDQLRNKSKTRSTGTAVSTRPTITN